MNVISIRGARQHNLKNIDIDLPRGKLVVVTGPSGSGKSSLVFDTIYAEGQRRYVESLSTQARQFLNVMEKPDVDSIEGLSPAVAIQQRGGSRSRRSTVGTLTEIADHLRLLFARAGEPYCHQCGQALHRQSVEQIVDTLSGLPDGTRYQILAPLGKPDGGSWGSVLDDLRKQGYVRVMIGGEAHAVDDPIDTKGAEELAVIVDRLVAGPKVGRRLADSLETALSLTGGLVVADEPGAESRSFTTRLYCQPCDIHLPDPEPRLLSFNSPHGACPTCNGLGESLKFSADRVVPDPELSVGEGAIAPFGSPKGKREADRLSKVLQSFGADLLTRYKDLTEPARDVLLNGRTRPKFAGILSELQTRYDESSQEEERERLEPYMRSALCPTCKGDRLRKEALAIRLGGESIAGLSSLTLTDTLAFFETLDLGHIHREIAEPLISEITGRLRFLLDVGVGYLSLARGGTTLSGGEMQRIRLATQIGSRLVGVLYVLDEPSVGLHPRDNLRLIASIERLRDLGNSVLVVEHDRDMIEAADDLVDLGPGAGELGGEVIAHGSPSAVSKTAASPTGAYLSGRSIIEVPEPNAGVERWLRLTGASGHNLDDVDLDLPLGRLVCISGVSGSGKSSLINHTLYPIIAKKLTRSLEEPLPYESIENQESIDKIIRIDQSPIGRTPRSNPATYVGIFGAVRELFAQLPESKVRGYGPGRFSFNTRGGRCEVCRGDGVSRVEMHFLPDVYVTCDACGGKRFNRETLEILFKGLTIADVLDLTVEQAQRTFRDIPQLNRRLKTLVDVGLGYIRLGQSATALSGGEAQRVKLSAELSRASTGNTLYLLDEPTTGLHFEDIRILLSALRRLVDEGNTVVVIEHNLDVIRSADWVIDLGPGGGPDGGHVVATGTPEQIADSADSVTGRFLEEVISA